MTHHHSGPRCNTAFARTAAIAAATLLFLVGRTPPESGTVVPLLGVQALAPSYHPLSKRSFLVTATFTTPPMVLLSRRPRAVYSTTTRLNFRDLPLHEDDVGVTTTTTTKTKRKISNVPSLDVVVVVATPPTLPIVVESTAASPETSSRHNDQEDYYQHVPDGIHAPLIATVLLSQILTLLLTTAVAAVVCGGDWSHLVPPYNDYYDFYSTGSSGAPWLSLVATGSVAAAALIGTSRVVSAYETTKPVTVTNFHTTHLCLQMFGRRQRFKRRCPPTTSTRRSLNRSSEGAGDNTNGNINSSSSSISELSTTTITTAATAVWLALLLVTTVTALTEEVIFRVYVPAVLYAMPGGSIMAAVLGQAVAYGLGHVHWDPHDSTRVENVYVAIQQTMAALLYASLVAATHSLIPSILSHMLFDMHILAETWHTVNGQMDHVEDQMTAHHRHINNNRSQTPPKANDVVQPSARPRRLSPEAGAIGYRFFHAFDSERQGSLNEADFARAIAYAFPQSCPGTAPREFRRHATTSNNNSKNKNEPPRLEYAAFLQILDKLRKNEQEQERAAATIAASASAAFLQQQQLSAAAGSCYSILDRRTKGRHTQIVASLLLHSKTVVPPFTIGTHFLSPITTMTALGKILPASYYYIFQLINTILE